MNLDQYVVLAGILAFIVVAVTTIVRQRKLEVADIGAFLGAYMSGCNIPAAIFLCFYAFSPDPLTVPTKLHGSEKFVSLAGVALLCLAVVSLWLLCKNAYEKAPATNA